MRQVSRRAFAAAMLAMPAARAWAGADNLDRVAPELRPAAREILSRFGSLGDYTPALLHKLRAGSPMAGPAPLASPAWQKRAIKGPPGAPDVTIYVINAKPGAHRGAILHTHGGGYILGSAADGIAGLQATAAALDCVIVTVEYRLAPETPYTGSVEDNYAALLWLHRNAAALGADPARIAVMGESAGGGHAALLAIQARDRGQVKLAFQALIYPMLDDRTGSTRPVPAPLGHLLWTAGSNRFGWQSFLGQAPGGPTVPVRAVPARTASLAGLPPAFIGVGSLDLFADEDIEYARRLLDAGVPTELLVVPGAFHGFDVLAPQTSLAKAFSAARLGALRRALA